MTAKEVKRVNNEPSMNSTLTDNIEKNIKTVELDKTHKMLVEHLSEWGALKGNINRLLELEAELAYLVNALKQQDELILLSKPDEIIADFSAPELLSIDKKENSGIAQESPQIITSVKQSEGVNNTKFKANNSNTVQTFAAPKLPVAAAEPLEGVNKSKFIQAGFNGDSDKVSHLKQDAKKQAGCRPNFNQTGKYALHLISVSEAEKISEAHKQMTQKYNDTLCGKYLKIAQVLMRDTEFNSLRFGPFVKKEEAQKACSRIQSAGQYCSVAMFDGYTFSL